MLRLGLHFGQQELTEVTGRMQKREVGTEIVYDYDTGKYFRLNQNNGETALCDVQGYAVPNFYMVPLSVFVHVIQFEI